MANEENGLSKRLISVNELSEKDITGGSVIEGIRSVDELETLI